MQWLPCYASPMPLFQRRREHERRAAETAAGKPRPLVPSFPAEARTKLVWAGADNVPAVDIDLMRRLDASTLARQQAAVLVREWGRVEFTSNGLPDYLVRKATDDEVVDIIESWFVAATQIVALVTSNDSYGGGWSEREALNAASEAYRNRVNEILDDHDIAWQLVGDEMIPRSSTAMHATIIEPVLALTTGDARYSNVEKAYQAALRELKPGGSPSDAITDAATSLQEMLEALGARGNALGSLLADLRKRQLLSPYDSKLAEAINALGDWVSADRSSRGDAHHVREASRDDAWLAVRVAGALILRLAAGRTR